MTERRWIPIVLVALSFLAGAGARTAWNALTGDDAGEVVANIVLDPAGNEVSFDHGAGTVAVPAGAVSAPQSVEIRKLTIADRVQAVPRGGGEPQEFAPGTLTSYSFGPDTVDLKRPVSVTFTLPAGRPGLAFTADHGRVRVLSDVRSGPTVTLSITSFDFNDPDAVTVQDTQE